VVLTRKRGACREEEEGWVDDLLGRGRTGGSFLGRRRRRSPSSVYHMDEEANAMLVGSATC
jgi:hypothetical protein